MSRQVIQNGRGSNMAESQHLCVERYAGGILCSSYYQLPVFVARHKRLWQCPVTAKDVSLQELASTLNFCLYKAGDNFHLKKTKFTTARCKDSCTLPEEPGANLWFGHHLRIHLGEGCRKNHIIS